MPSKNKKKKTIEPVVNWIDIPRRCLTSGNGSAESTSKDGGAMTDFEFFTLMRREFKRIFPPDLLRKWELRGQPQTKAIFKKLAELGIPAAWIPRRFQVGEFKDEEFQETLRRKVLIAIALASVSPFIHLSLSGSALGMSHAFAVGTDEQVQPLIKGLLSGDIYMAWGLTPPESGSDPLSGGTRVVRHWKRNGYFILNGERVLVTNGSTAPAAVVMAKTGEDAFSAFLIRGPRRKGYPKGSVYMKGALGCSETSQLIFHDFVVSEKQLLGTWAGAMDDVKQVLLEGRAFFGSGAIGVLIALLYALDKHMAHRRSGGVPLANIQQLQWMLREIQRVTAILFDLFMEAVGAQEAGDLKRFRYLVTLAKVLATTEGDYLAGQAGEIFGGESVDLQSEISELRRSFAVSRVGEGANPKLITMLKKWERKSPQLFRRRKEIFKEIYGKKEPRWWHSRSPKLPEKLTKKLTAKAA